MADRNLGSFFGRAHHRGDHCTDSDQFPRSDSLVSKRSSFPQLYGIGLRQRDQWRFALAFSSLSDFNERLFSSRPERSLSFCLDANRFNCRGGACHNLFTLIKGSTMKRKNLFLMGSLVAFVSILASHECMAGVVAEQVVV